MDIGLFWGVAAGLPMDLTYLIWTKFCFLLPTQKIPKKLYLADTYNAQICNQP